MSTKALQGKGYGHIPHLPGSRMGDGDHHCHEGQARICTERARDKHDRIIVQEKLDGSCVGVLRDGDTLIPINRAGYAAASSPWEQHHLFADWVMEEPQRARFMAVLHEGERLMGEWLALAHGTRYKLFHEPFVAFDIIDARGRFCFEDFMHRITGRFINPCILYSGGPLSVADAFARMGKFGHHGALDRIEGAVWRVERKNVVDFVVKYVRPDKVDGCYLPEVSGNESVWNWRPEVAAK